MMNACKACAAAGSPAWNAAAGCSVQRHATWTPRIASRRNVTGAVVLRARRIAICRRWQDGGRAQPDRSLATAGVRLSDLARAGGRRGDDPLGRLVAKRLQEPLHDRMLLWTELIGVALCEPSDDRKGCQLRLGREPAFDDC